MTRLLQHLERLHEEHREQLRPGRDRTGATRPSTDGFRDCRGTWHPWDEPWDGPWDGDA